MAAVRRFSPRAPVIDQRRRSSPVAASKPAKLGAAPSKTQRFLWFQNIQDPMITRVLIPSRWSPLAASSNRCRQESKHCSFGWGASEWSPTWHNIWNQNCLANTHPTRRWSTDSTSWSQSEQWSWWGNPCRANLSAVQQRLCAARISWLW
jgi:hypothetical protein